MAKNITVGKRKSLISSNAVIQAPWVKVTIGNYTFGVFSKTREGQKDAQGFYSTFQVQYPNFIQELTVNKLNGKINQYSLSISYPVRPGDDPNFFEKVFSSVSSTRKIVFSYGDAMMPSYVFKDEEAIITKISQSFNFGNGGQMGSVIGYQVEAISTVSLSNSGCFTFTNSGLKKPSDEIKAVFKDKRYGLTNIFTGMSLSNLDSLIDGDDKAVELDTKINIAPLDYINYLVGCMVPAGSTVGNTVSEIYILTVHDDTIYDTDFSSNGSLGGPYFKVTKVSSLQNDHSDAFEIDIGWNGATIVTDFQVQDNENYSMLFDYQQQLNNDSYVRRLDNTGLWIDEYAPVNTSKNTQSKTRTEDVIWWSKLTQFPIKASITLQGLLRAAELMSYVRLNVIFPGGRKHISSGLYIVTGQKDSISNRGYRTTLSLTRIAGDSTDPDYN